EISLRITSGYTDPSGIAIANFFLTTGAQTKAHIGGDGTAPFQADTVFVVEFSEVRPGLGFRPPSVNCQICGTVTGTVTNASTGLPIANAMVVAQGVLENHPFS